MRRLFPAVFVMSLCLSLFCLSNVSGAEQASEPVYQQQPYKVVQVRGGIGNTEAKLQAGEPVTVAYFGGSITAANGWRPKTTAWLKQQYPNAQITEVHAAIGGTGSDLGVFRNGFDVLRHKPDLVFVEFSVNDGGASPENIWRQMEGIVRQTWSANPKTDIVFTYTFVTGYEQDTLNGFCSRAASAMEQLAEFYGIPSINFCPRIVAMKAAGTLVYKGDGTEPDWVVNFSGDNVHPHDAGHELYLKDIQLGWNQMKSLAPVDHGQKLSRCFVSDNYQAAKMVDITPDMLEGNWQKLEPGQPLYWAADRMGEVWTASQPGSTLTFTVKASQVKIYDLIGPNGGQVTISVNGKEGERPTPLFDSYCTYHRLATLWCASNLNPDEETTIVVKIHPEQPSRQSVAFRLQNPEKELAEPKFQGTNVWFGKIMILGDMVTK